jgi:hypothetical protein
LAQNGEKLRMVRIANVNLYGNAAMDLSESRVQFFLWLFTKNKKLTRDNLAMPRGRK